MGLAHQQQFNTLANPDGVVNDLLVSLSDRSYNSVTEATGMDVTMVWHRRQSAPSGAGRPDRLIGVLSEANSVR